VLGNAWDAERAIDAPLDGYMLSRSPRDLASAKRLLYCLGSGEAQTLYVTWNPNTVPAVQDPLTFWYTPFQRRIDAVLRRAGATAQFLDRDARPDLADGMERFLRVFVSDPDQDPGALLADVQTFRDGLP
jgi:multiple sugar transport system substrate-binding protein